MKLDTVIKFLLVFAGGAAVSSALRDNKEQPALSSLDSEEGEDKKIRKLLKRGYHEDAVRVACNRLFDLIREKSGEKDKDCMKLIDHVFTPAKPILKITRHDEHSHLDTHDGYYFLLKGVVAAIRNPASHENLKMELKEAEAQIALIDYLYFVIEHYTLRVPPKIKK